MNKLLLRRACRVLLGVLVVLICVFVIEGVYFITIMDHNNHDATSIWTESSPPSPIVKDNTTVFYPFVLKVLLANRLNISHWKVSAAFGVLQLIVGVSVVAIRPYGTGPVIFLLLAYFMAFIRYSAFVRKKAAAKF